MGTIWVKQFAGGLDTRRMPVTTPGGSLIYGRDGHINRGGEFEQRAKFVSTYSLPGGTVGLAATSSAVVVFGGSGAPAGIPAGVTYQRLKHPGNEALVEVPSWDLFDDKILACARFANGDRYLFFDGERIPDANWPSGRPQPNFVKTIRKQVYTLSGSYWIRSGILPTSPSGASAFNFVPHNTDNPAAFIINMSTETGGAEKLKSMARYGEYVVIFAERSIQTWTIDPDPDLCRQAQTLLNTGTFAPQSVTQFGDADIFYLDESGVRSVKARSTTDAAYASDVGNPIDDLVIADMAALTTDEREAAIGLVEPVSGRYWLAAKDKIYVFSYYSGSKVSAWTDYGPGFPVEHVALSGKRTYLRSGDTIYTYGGLEAAPVYTDVEAELWTPYLDAGKPAQTKRWTAVDMAALGTWEIRIGMDPNDTGTSDLVASAFDGTTYGSGAIQDVGNSTHASLRFKLVTPPASGPAKVGACILHNDLTDPED